MGFTLDESPESGATTIEPPTLTMVYIADGEPDPSQVQINAYLGTAQTVFTNVGILYRQDVKVDPVGGPVFKVTVPYGTAKHQTGSYTFNFDTTGGTAKATCAKLHVQTYYPSGGSGDTNPHKGLINVTLGKDSADGVNIIIPALKFNVTWRAPQGTVTIAYVQLLAQVTGKTNSDTFLGFQPGELLLLGATGSDGTEAESEVNFQFAASQNATGLTIGSISGIAKNGWDYYWTESQNSVGSDGTAALIPLRGHVERVYDSISFSGTFGWSG